MTIKFNPPKSSNAPPPVRSALRKADVPPPSVSLYTLESEPAEERDLFEDPPSLIPPAWPLTLDLALPGDEPDDASINGTKSEFASSSMHVNNVESLTEKSQASDLPEYIGTAISTPSISVDLTRPSMKIGQSLDLEDETQELASEKSILDPFQDPVEEAGSGAAPGLLPTEQVVLTDERNRMSFPMPEEPDHKVSTNALETHLPLQPSEPIVTKGDLEEKDELLRKDISEVAEVPNLERSSVLDLEQLLPQQSTRVPSPEVLALLKSQDEEEGQTRSSTVPEIDTLLRIVAQQNESLADKPLFWSDFRALDPEVELAMDLTLLSDRPQTGEILSPRANFLSHDMNTYSSDAEARERKLSPVRRNPATKVSSPEEDLLSSESHTPVALGTTEQHEPTSSFFVVGTEQETTSAQPTLTNLAKDERREVSPLRMNPQIRNITSLLAERGAIDILNEQNLDVEKLEVETESDDREERGRSMIRTSDLIEARSSIIARMREEDQKTKEQSQIIDSEGSTSIKLNMQPQGISETTALPSDKKPNETDREKRKSRTLSPPKSKYPAPIVQDSRDRTESPLRRNPVDLALAATIRDRTKSPLRRNPSNASSFVDAKQVPSMPPIQNFIPVSRSASTGPRPASNAAFSEALSKFRTLASENPIETSQASTEVTQRAIAGIFIPGSLREQAVRNLSKSRERGKGIGSGSRSGSRPGGN
jgi:hypothetical protein